MSAAASIAVPTVGGAAPAGARQPTAAGGPWMVSAPVDLVLFVAVTLTTLVPWVVSDVLHVDGQYVLIGVAFANGPHLISTWTRVYLTRRDRFARPFNYWLMPALCAAIAISCRTALGDFGQAVISSTIFYWASWHFVSQSWGVLRIYQRKHGLGLGPIARLEKALVFLPALFFVLHRLYTGPWTLFGTEVFHVRPRAWMVNTLGAGIVLLAAGYLVLLVAAARAGRPTPRVRPAYLAFNAIGFGMPYLVIKDGTSAFAAAALWHAIQYIAIVWLYNRRTYASGVTRDALFVSWVSQPGRSAAYVGLITLCAAGVYAVAALAWAAFGGRSFMEWGLTLWTALTLGHYYLDGVIWRTRRYDLRQLQT